MNIKLEIPKSFYQGEERCGYYVSPEMKKVWAVELDLLNEFARVCDKYNIRWYADSGTLLGAVRHKGYIPWDDDVDIVMMRKDYDYFCEIAEQEFKPPYHLSTYKNDGANMLLPFAKLHNEDTTMIEPFMFAIVKQGVKLNYSQGIYIDIFPADDVPDDDKLFKRRIRKAKFFWNMAKVLRWRDVVFPSSTKKAWKTFTKISVQKLLRTFTPSSLSHRKYFMKFLEIMQFNSPDSKRIINSGTIVIYSDFNTPYIFNRSDFAKIIKLPFEMIELNAPSGYVNILDKLYGDWHKFKITKKHSAFYDTERSYKYYTEEGHPFKTE